MTSATRLRLIIYVGLIASLGIGGMYYSRAMKAERLRAPLPFGTTKFTRPQEPKPPYPYAVDEVTIQNAAAKVTLAGTLTLPTRQGIHPAVLLIPGTGPHDRNGSGAGHRPFHVLADYLTRRGIAVLHCDRRGAGRSTGRFEPATQADFASDALASIAYLRSHPEIDPRRIGLLGHSEGGVVAMLACGSLPEPAFLVLLASPGLPLADVTARQHRDAARAFGIDRRLIENWIATYREFHRLVITSNNAAATERGIRRLWAEQVAPLSDEDRRQLGIHDGALNELLAQARRPGFVSAARADPRNLLSSVRCPVLALNGDKDVQVSADENLPAIKTALLGAGNRHVKAIVLPKLNHLFQTCETGLVSEYPHIDETFSPTAMKLIGDWILDLSPES